MKRSLRGFLASQIIALALSAAAQPLVTPDQPVLKLDEVGLYDFGYAYRGKPEQFFPVGWSGFFDDRTGVACLPFGTQAGRNAFLLHSPWRGGTGVAFQEFRFAIPGQASKVTIRGATAMRTENVTNSDGVTFRIYLNGTRVMSYHQTNDVWRPFEHDLKAFRGRSVKVRFEVDPGPRDDPSFDYSLWGERELVIEGFSPAAPHHPSPPLLASSNLWSGTATEIAPTSGYRGVQTTRQEGNTARFRYQGPDGTLEYEWTAPANPAEGLFGKLVLHARMTNDAPVDLPLAGSAALSWIGGATALDQGWTREGDRCTLWRTFKTPSATATVRVTGEMVGKSLALTTVCDQPVADAFDAGGWGPVVRRRQTPTPYYTGSVWYLPAEGLFAGEILDWTASSARAHNGNRAIYPPMTDGSRNPVRERVVYTAAWHLEEVLPNPPNPPSPWRGFLADKIVLDVWGGRFGEIESNLGKLARFGISPGMVIIHDWQRSGYDNALPAHYPANAAYGGDAAMRQLVAGAEALGFRCALHENYIDYYPNYEHFTTNDLAVESDGRLQKAWYNPGTKIQSFAMKPEAILRLAGEQSPEIHRRYQTRADYLDVHSSVTPWFHVDEKAGDPGAGKFQAVWDTNRRLWAFERTTHGGPVLGEGNNHWYWSGCLDGVEAQFGSGWPGNGGFSAPLAVDFDLLKIHPLQFNHGMGYHSRWWPTESFQTNWAGGPTPMVVLDRYRAQEVAFGHAGFLDGSTYANVPAAWLEHHLLAPLMARYATARPVEIRYEWNGAWLDASGAARTGAQNAFERVRVRYENGLTVTVNGASNTLAVGKWKLPDWGWVAEAPGFAAGTVLRQGAVTDFADTGDTFFVNARAALDWNQSHQRMVQPVVALFESTGPGKIRVSYRWDVRDTLPRNYQCFVHFNSGETIRLQQDHRTKRPTSEWISGTSVTDGPWEITLPEGLGDGDYSWWIGLFDPTGDGGRAQLQGPGDGAGRILLGTLRVSEHGAGLVFLPETNRSKLDPAAWYTPHLNRASDLIDFDGVRTDGSLLLRREGNGWRMNVWPAGRSFALNFDGTRFPAPAAVRSPGGSAPEATPMPAGTGWRLPLNGAEEYRW